MPHPNTSLKLFRSKTLLFLSCSVQVGGKRNFRSKRFSRNLDREPALKRAQSFHMDQRMDGDTWLDQQRR